MYARIIGRFKRSEFSKNTATVFLGSIISQGILIVSTLWLSRLYPPESFGLYGVFIGIGNILGLLMTLRYTQAIIISETKEKSFSMLQICINLSIAFFLFFSLLFFVLLSWLLHLFNAEDLGKYFLLVPLFAAVFGINESLFVWLNWNKAYRYISINRVVTAVITVVTSITWAYYIDNSCMGLIFGTILGQGLGTILLIYRSNRFHKFTLGLSFFNARRLMKAYRSFPFYTLPSDFINVLTNQLPVLMLNKFALAADAGHYSMCNRILGLPSTFVSSAISEVFRQRSAEDYHRTGTCRPIFMKALKFLTLAGIPVFALIAIFGPTLFSFLLGKEWTNAGLYSRILALLFCFKFIVSPLTVTFFVAQKQRMDFFIHILMLVFAALPLYIGFVYFNDPYYSLLFYSVSYSLIYLLYLFLSLNYATAAKSSVRVGSEAPLLTEEAY
jgi:teichuronic acid exporter